MSPQDLAADLRSRINPAYAAQLGTESHERRLCAEAIEDLIAQVSIEKERADYGWRNVDTIEKARVEEMRKRDAAQAEVAALKATVGGLLEILRQWEPDWSSGEDRRTIVLAMYQVGILTDPTKTTEAMKVQP